MAENTLRYYSKMIAHRLKNYEKGFDFSMGIVCESARTSAFVDLVVEQHGFEVFNVPLSMICYRKEDTQCDAMAGALTDIVQDIARTEAKNPLILIDGLDHIEYDQQKSINDFINHGVDIAVSEGNTSVHCLDDFEENGNKRKVPIIVVSRYDFTPQLHYILRNTLHFYASNVDASPIVRKHHVKREDNNRKILLEFSKTLHEEQKEELSQKIQKNSHSGYF
jgi:hypothetical protein